MFRSFVISMAGFLSIVATVRAQSFDSVINTIGPEAYYRLNDIGATATDETGNHHGTYFGSPTQGVGSLPGISGNSAVKFDEIDDRVTISDFGYGTSGNGMAVGFGFNLDNNAGNAFKFMYSHGTNGTANSLNVYFREDSSTSPGAITTSFRDSNDAGGSAVDIPAGLADGQWHYYSFVADPTRGASIYVDGALRHRDANRGTDAFNPVTDIFLGAREDLDGARYFGSPDANDGLLDEAVIFDKSVSGEDIRRIATAAVGTTNQTFRQQINAANPIAYLPLDDIGTGAGNTAVDQTGNNPGTYQNGVTLGLPGTYVGGPNTSASFDEVNDHVTISDFGYGNDDGSGTGLTLGFWFNEDDNSGGAFEYMFNHGDPSGPNSVFVNMGEGGGGDIRTRFRDSNDPGATLTTDAIFADGQWHLYTLTASPTDGLRVYVDGLLRNEDATLGTDLFDPTGDLFLGAISTLDADRFFGGSLDEFFIIDEAFTDVQIRDLFLSAPTAAAVPEPTSIAVWILLSGVAGILISKYRVGRSRMPVGQRA